ncbi:MAG: type II toxin-antitoxin system VapC family toxin [Actinobacteria bacterium]|nr:type II toxin-antitoxin system VapC family toxin [Actinomycetota bacterium]
MTNSSEAVPVKYVLDSYALLAHLRDEPAAAHIRTFLDRAQRGECLLYVSVINLGEILYRTEREYGSDRAGEVLRGIEVLPISLVAAGADLAIDAAHVKARYPIAYADCFAVALAQREGATVVTGDPEFRWVETIVDIEWLGEAEG